MRIIDEDMNYFLTNEEWYNYDEEKDFYTLTDKIPQDPRIKKSYNDYLERRKLRHNCLFADLNNIDIDNEEQINTFIENIDKK